MKDIALFGGSFDPPHIGHKAIVDVALRDLDIDKLIIEPAFLNPFKSKSFAPADMRLRWLLKLFKNYQNVSVDDFEIKQNKKVPTIETVLHLLKTYDKIYLIIGADNLSSLHKWYRFDKLKKLVTFVVASRDDIKIPPEYISLDVDAPISSTALRAQIQQQFLPREIAQEIKKFYKEYN